MRYSNMKLIHHHHVFHYIHHKHAFGTPEEVMTDADLEKVYGLPASMLKHSEMMTRNQIKEESDMIKTL